jgi:hypothetical protein
MGCDIHFFVEKQSIDSKRNNKINEVFEADESENTFEWVTADKYSINKYYSPDEDDGEPEYIIEYSDRFYNGRNYALFEYLSGVRGDDDNAISKPRGVPKDVSNTVKYEIDSYGSDGHSHSYFTLDELLQYDFSKFPIFEKTIEKMKSIDEDYTKVRCIFFFDN